MSCANRNCGKNISGLFHRERKCLKCQRKFCKECFMILLESKSIKIKGYCNDCYIEEKPEDVFVPKYIGENIPTQKSVRII